MSARKVTISLPLIDPALVRAMRAASFDRRRLVRRFSTLVRGAFSGQGWASPAIGVRVRRYGEAMAHPRFEGSWQADDAAHAAYLIGQATGRLIVELSTLAMEQACAGELEPKRGRYKR